MTNKAIEKLPEICRKHCDSLKYELKRSFEDRRRDLYNYYKGEIKGYLFGLKDAGIITETERRCLFLYYGTL